MRQQLSELRRAMQAHGIDLYIIPTDDFHASEYVGAHFRGRHYVSGFTGSAGTLVVTADWAGLWTDGRYFLQAGQQLEGSGIELCKMGEPGVPTIPEYLEKTLEAGQTLGFDGRVVTARQYEGYQRIAEKKQGKIVSDVDLLDEIWAERPALSAEPAWELPVSLTGRSRQEKLHQVRREMESLGAMSIDVAIDRAMYQLIFSRLKGTHSPVTLQYFRGHVDLLNAVALLRVRQMKEDEAFFMSVLLDGGTIRAQSWRLCFAQPDMLSAMLAPYGASVTEAAKNAVMDGKRLPALEKAMDDALLELYRPFRFQICPERAAAYFLAVQRETAAVRLILAGKQNGFDAENIRERLRDLYV